MENILISLYFMKCAHFNFKSDPDKVLLDEQEFEMSQTEGVKASEIVEKISKQQPLSKWKNPEVKPSLCYWLDPIQSEIMDDSNPYQIIVGPASTGKTLLIQLKVLQMLHKAEKEAVLIILPLQSLKQNYVKFFMDCGLQDDCDLFITTIRENWMSLVHQYNPHVFIDEFAAVWSIEKEVIDEILKPVKTNQQITTKLIWITIDFLQSFEILTLGLPQIQDKHFVETATKSHLLLVHRCTKSVFQVWFYFVLP
jgi:hypothetical protein